MTNPNGFTNRHGPHRTTAELLAMCSPHAWVGVEYMRFLQAQDKEGPTAAECSCGWKGMPRSQFQDRLADHARHQREAREAEG